jgi:2-dehydro-3-deoxyphosphooctonate aldolase (KDO 8-P synthase)
MKMKTISVGKIKFGNNSPLALIAGPCVIESYDGCMALAKKLVAWAKKEKVPYIFKASFDKANRSSGDAYRGPGLAAGMEILADIKDALHVPILTDVHEPWQAEAVAGIADIIQIPAFLCRQTDLVEAVADTGAAVNVKKGQFMAPEDIVQVIKKIEARGNKNILLTERGASFGYRNLVADMRSLLIMKETGYPVIFDATHSVQRPGGLRAGSGGDGQWAPALARAAVATGAADALFIETHACPEKSLSDKANAIAFKDLPPLWKQLNAIAELVKRK